MVHRSRPSRRAVLGGLVSSMIMACGRTGAGPASTSRRSGGMTFAYGRSRSQQADLHLPPHRADAAPVVVLLHGGYWQRGYDRSLMAPLARDLAERGIAAWNVDYRPVGAGGGWPSTFADVAAAVDLLAGLAERHHLDLGRVVTIGHSAGGTLALWAASRRGLPVDALGGRPRVVPCAAVSQAGINDLVSGDSLRLGGGACEELMGGAAAVVPGRYQLASPRARLPLHLPQLLVHGRDDEQVPIDQSRDYVKAAETAGDRVQLLEFAGADHFTLIEPTARPWKAVADGLPGLYA